MALCQEKEKAARWLGRRPFRMRWQFLVLAIDRSLSTSTLYYVDTWKLARIQLFIEKSITQVESYRIDEYYTRFVCIFSEFGAGHTCQIKIV